MKSLFSGRKRIVIVPLASILGLIFLPLTILFLLAWLTHSRVESRIVKILSYSTLAFLAIPFVTSYFLLFTHPVYVNSVSEQSQPPLVNLNTKKLEDVLPETVPPITTQPPPSAKQVETSSESVTTYSPKIETPVPVAKTSFNGSAPSNEEYACDCSKSCKEISSCKEALFQLNECGCSKRDGDNDGIACDGSPLNCQR